MLESYLLPIEEAAYVFFFLALGLLMPICVIQYRQFGWLQPVRILVFYSFLFYVLAAIFLIILPLPELTPDFCKIHTIASQMRVIPFQFMADITAENEISFSQLNLISILESSAFLQAFFNFLLLIPLGFYLRYYFCVRFRVATIAAIATTLFFEITQITGIYGLYPCPYRVFDVDDLILNTAGALLGYAIAPMFHFLSKLQQQPCTKPATVTIPRRLVAFVIDCFLANTVTKLLVAQFHSTVAAEHQIWIDLAVYFV